MKKIAYISCLGIIATLSVEFGVIGLLPQIAGFYNISIDKAGRLLGVYELAAAISGPFMALLVSNADRRKVLLACLVISISASIFSSFAPPFNLLLFSRVLVAFTDSIYHAASLASVIRNKDEKEDARLMAIVLSGFSFASITVIPLAAYIGSTFNWQLAFMLKAVVSAAAMAGILIVSPSMPVTKRKTFRGQLSIITRPVFLWTAALCFFMVASAFCLYSYFAEYLGKEKQMSGQMISLMLFIFGAMGIAGNWLAGKTAGKNLFLTCMASVLSVLVVAAGFWFSGVQLLANIVVIAVWGMLFSFGPLVITSYINRAAPDAMEFGFALSASFIGIGISAGAYVGGLVIVSKGASLAPWSGTGFCLAAILTLFMINWLEKKHKRFIIQGKTI